MRMNEAARAESEYEAIDFSQRRARDHVWIHRQLRVIVNCTYTGLIMNSWRNDTWRHLRIGEAFLAGGVESLFQGWKASTEMLGKLWTGGAERWQAANRQIQASVNLADILRARTPT